MIYFFFSRRHTIRFTWPHPLRQERVYACACGVGASSALQARLPLATKPAAPSPRLLPGFPPPLGFLPIAAGPLLSGGWRCFPPPRPLLVPAPARTGTRGGVRGPAARRSPTPGLPDGAGGTEPSPWCSLGEGQRGREPAPASRGPLGGLREYTPGSRSGDAAGLRPPLPKSGTPASREAERGF